MKCYNCKKNAMFAVGPEGKQIPLCLDCYIRFENVEQQKLASLERSLNYLSEEMESMVGLPGILPRYPERPAPRVIQTGGITLNNIRVSNSEIGVLNTGTIQNVDSTVTVLKSSGNSVLAQAVTALSEAVIKSNEISNKEKNQIIELLGAVAAEAVAPKEKQRRSVIKALLSQISGMLSGVGSLAAIWDKVKGIFEQVFGT